MLLLRYVVVMSVLGIATKTALAQERVFQPVTPAMAEEVLPSPMSAIIDPPPPVRFVIEDRKGTSTTDHHGLNHISGGFIEVTLPSPEIMVITVTGLASAAGNAYQSSHSNIDVNVVQQFRIEAMQPNVIGAKMVMNTQLIGVLRCQREGAGMASVGPCNSLVSRNDINLLEAIIPQRTHTGEGNEFINDRSSPQSITVNFGSYTLSEHFRVEAGHPKRWFHKNVATAAFGPDSPRPPEWLSLLDAHRDLPKQRDTGYRVSLRLIPITKK